VFINSVTDCQLIKSPIEINLINPFAGGVKVCVGSAVDLYSGTLLAPYCCYHSVITLLIKLAIIVVLCCLDLIKIKILILILFRELEWLNYVKQSFEYV